MQTLGKRAQVFVPGQGWSKWMPIEAATQLEAQIETERQAAARAAGGTLISITQAPPRQPKREREHVILSEDE